MVAPCNRCEVPLTAWDAANSDDAECAYCASHSLVRVFPALFQERTTVAPAPEAAEGEATCFDHPSKRAVAHCSQCGRFVCQLCTIDFRGATWCPECFAAGRTRQKAFQFEQGRTLYDSIALWLAVAPLIFWPLTVFTAPAALFVAIRYWSRPQSLVRWKRWRSVLAILLASVQVGGWIWVVAYFFLYARTVK